VDPEKLVATIEPIVRTWEFEPAVVDGVPTSAKTGLNVLVALQLNAAGTYDYAVLDARVAPLSRFIGTPIYPIAGIRDNKEAFVDVTLRVGADGTTVVEAVDVRANGHEALFEAQVREAARGWLLEPDVVGGVAVESRVHVPVSFCLQIKRSWCEKQRAAGNAPSRSGEPVAIDPRVRLKTDVRGTGS
jgi:outer membrane biosynthesis protein TonB